MKYNFDKVIDRYQTNSYKWDNGVKDLMPMWVADMDFEVPKPIKEAMIKKAEHGIYGYTLIPDSYYDAIINWEKKRHDWQIKKEWIMFSPGVLPGISMFVRALTQPGDKVIIQTPVYYPFFGAITNNGAQIERNPLIYENGIYRMDINDLEEKAKNPRAQLLILCSPHNPVGRVWSREELKNLGRICLKNNVTVIADEIHCDLIFKGYKHTPFAFISDDFQQNSITCIAPSKTFNLAGLQTSAFVIPDEKLRQRFLNVLESNFLLLPNAFGIAAFEAAYNHGEEWLEQLLDYLQGNFDFLVQFTQKYLPKVNVIKTEGTYLVWMDFRGLGLDKNALEDLMLNQAKIWLDEGYIFGEEGAGFERINIACPRSILEQGLQRIADAMKNL